MKKALLIILLCLVCVFGWGGTYYIDYNAADDSANGTAKETPWKRHPYMATFGGSYSHSAGDQFIFKGGVTWLNVCFPMAIVAGGSGEGTRDYYGVDETWYTGGSWTRPIFDLEDTETTTSNTVFDFSGGLSYITVDNIEVDNFYWNGAPVYGYDVIFVCRTGTYFTFQNLYIHDWSHGIYADGTRDQAYIFLGNTSAPFGTGCIIEDSIVDGSRVADSMTTTYGGFPIIRNNTIHDIPNGLFSVGNSYTDHLCYGNDIYNIRDSFDAGQHENGITIYGPGKTYNNKIHDLDVGQPLYPGPSIDMTGDMLFYNNIVWNVPDTYPMTVDNETGDMTGTIYILNNIFRGYDGTGACIRIQDRGYTFAEIVIQNNHYITSAADPTAVEAEVTVLTESDNLKQTDGEATAEGYVVGNEFAPTHAGDSTVNAGTNKSGLFTLDIDGISRPQGAAWDIGAYEYEESFDIPRSRYKKELPSLLATAQVWGLYLLNIYLLIALLRTYRKMKYWKGRALFYDDNDNLNAMSEINKYIEGGNLWP